MAEYKSFKAVFKNIEKQVKTSQKQALARATTSTRALYAKEVGAELGITAARAKKRTYVDNGSRTGTKAEVVILTRTMFAAHEFKPKKQKVMSTRGMRYGASYMAKNTGRILTKNGFIAKGLNSGKTVIIERVGGNKSRETTTVYVNVFKPAVERMVSTLQAHMKSSFEKNFRSQLSFNLSK